MDIATNDTGGVPPVHILHERVGKGEGEEEVREVVMVGTFEKYKVRLRNSFILFGDTLLFLFLSFLVYLEDRLHFLTVSYFGVAFFLFFFGSKGPSFIHFPLTIQSTGLETGRDCLLALQQGSQ